MDQSVVEGLLNLRLTKEEEEEITITTKNRADLLEECALSLFGRLLSERNQNLRALKSTLKSAWKMGSDLQIVEVGNNVLQFKFNSEYQMQWVERNGPWNFENNLLLLCRWRKGLSASNIVFTHSPFWVQIWDLPFEHMSLEVGRELGYSLGNFIESDRRTGNSDQAKFMRIRVDLQLDKPLRRRGKVASDDGEKFWVRFKYERLPTFCYHCGRLGHDDKHCPETAELQNTSRQYGDWLRAFGSARAVGDRSKSTSNGEFVERREEYTHTGERNFTASVMEDGCGSTDGPGKNEENNMSVVGKSSGAGSEKMNSEQTLQGSDYPTRASQPVTDASVARAGTSAPPIGLPRDSSQNMPAKEALSLVGQKAQMEKDLMDVSSPIKPTPLPTDSDKGKMEVKTACTSPLPRKKTKTKVQIKKLAREKGITKGPTSDAMSPPVGSKRAGKLVFEDEEEDNRKKRCTQSGIPQPILDEISAVAAVQHRRKQ